MKANVASGSSMRSGEFEDSDYSSGDEDFPVATQNATANKALKASIKIKTKDLTTLAYVSRSWRI